MQTTELSEFEKSLFRKVRRASIPPSTASKRFMRSNPETIKLSDKGRSFLAFIAHRFRRQYTLSEEELAWISHWKEEHKHDSGTEKVSPEASTASSRP